MSNLTLDDLGEVRISVDLVRPDGRKLSVPLRAMSEQTIWQIRQGMAWPVPPMDIQRVDGKVQEVKKFDDPTYVKAMSAANRNFQYRLILQALCIDIPGANDDDKLKVMESKLGAWALNQLNAHILRLTGITETEVAEKAASFQGD